MFGFYSMFSVICIVITSIRCAFKAEHNEVMALRKRITSRVIVRAKKRLIAVEQIDAKNNTLIEYSGGDNLLTKKEFTEQIQECENLINNYNSKLEEADLIGVTIAKSEAKLSDMYTAILSGAKSRFGLDSDEVKMLGGTRKSERKKPLRKIL